MISNTFPLSSGCNDVIVDIILLSYRFDMEFIYAARTSCFYALSNSFIL